MPAVQPVSRSLVCTTQAWGLWWAAEETKAFLHVCWRLGTLPYLCSSLGDEEICCCKWWSQDLPSDLCAFRQLPVILEQGLVHPQRWVLLQGGLDLGTMGNQIFLHICCVYCMITGPEGIQRRGHDDTLSMCSAILLKSLVLSGEIGQGMGWYK